MSISEEQVKKLEEGITILNTILANQAPSQQRDARSQQPARHSSGVGKQAVLRLGHSNLQISFPSTS